MNEFTYKTDALTHGISSEAGLIASNWARRPADERFTSLQALRDFKFNDYQMMQADVLNVKNLHINGDVDENDIRQGNITLEFTDQNKQEHQAVPTHWSFGQISSLAGAPAGYLRDLPAVLAADCVKWGLLENRNKELVKSYKSTKGQLRALTGSEYGRIYDWEIVAAVQEIAAATKFKIHGYITGSESGMAVYDPFAPVTNESTTIYGSDRDVFIFLVDDLNPIEIGKLPNGEPDLVFRGFYISNSEVGAKSCKIATMYMRGICQNRYAWGVEDFSEITIRHTKFAAERFSDEAQPALRSFSNGSTTKVLDGIQAAQEAQVAEDEEQALKFLQKRVGLSARMAKAAYTRHGEEEQKPMKTIWDASNAITAIARDIPHQDNRLDLERKAGQLLDTVAA